MAKPTVVWQGLEEYRKMLLALPDSLRGEADNYVEENANAAAVDIRGAYPARTGNLRDGVEVLEKAAGRYGTARLVRTRAPHAVIFERGTVARHYFTRNNVKHLLGRMPAGHVFVPRVIRWRRRLLDQLKAMLERHGARVIDGA